MGYLGRTADEMEQAFNTSETPVTEFVLTLTGDAKTSNLSVILTIKDIDTHAPHQHGTNNYQYGRL